MSLSLDRFGDYFCSLWPYEPFPWQLRLAKQIDERGWPECIDLPTASGKTACIDVAVFVLACQANRETKDRTVGRRIFFTVNRRVIVDEAFDRAKKIAERLLKTVDENEDGILREVADALRAISGDTKAPPLDVAQLRGGIYRDRAWARSITQPIVVCTTVDQLGSRLLFRGYGVSQSMQPVHAALTACDSLILLDEAHVTRAFCQTMRLLSRYQRVRTDGGSVVPPMRFVQMTATPADAKDRFELNAADHSHPVLETRQNAPKPATLVKLDKKKPIVAEIVSRAFAALSETRKAVGVIVNRVQTAREIEEAIRAEIEKRAKKGENFAAESHLVIGRMRPIDRDDLQEHLRTLVGPDRPGILEKPVFVVATQCLEVGADYDFDALITECASIDALRQRFGRLNRKGRTLDGGTPFNTEAVIVTNDELITGDDPIYGDATKHTWEWLWSNRNKDDQIDFGIAAFKQHWDGLEDAAKQPMLAPAPDAAVLLPAHLDALCQTNPQPVPSPDVNFFIHGPQRATAEVNVCWRADLGPDDETAEKRWPEIVRLLPPTSPECMTVPLWEIRRWMRGAEITKEDGDADVSVASGGEQGDPKEDAEAPARRVVAWRGSKECRFVESPEELRPGDTVVIPVSSRSWLELGHIPDVAASRYERGTIEVDGVRRKETDAECDDRCKALDRSVDVAERATRDSKLRVVRRVHPAFVGSETLRGLSDPDLRQALIDQDVIPKRWSNSPVARLDRHWYPDTEEDAPDEVIIFMRLLDPPNKLVAPSDDEDDGDDALSVSDQLLSLEDHTQHVVERVDAALPRLSLCGIASAVREAARLHDLGKADVRFQAMLAGLTPYEAIERPVLLGKGDGTRRSQSETQRIFDRAMYPRGFRHEMLSVELIEHLKLGGSDPHRDLILHVVAAHHGYARPFAPVCIDDAADDELRSVRVNGWEIPGHARRAWTPSHRLDSGVAERFWLLTRMHGWWGLAWLESVLRLADQQASASEQEQRTPQPEELR